MQAWQFVEPGTPLTLREVDEPVAGPGEVVVDVLAAGICHTDTGYVDGTLTSVLGFYPITLGHEIAGTVASIGEGVDTFAVGDRVAVPSKVEGAGTSANGGFASKVVSRAEWVVAIPGGVDYDQAAAATDAGLTAYQAMVTRGGVRKDMKVGLIGLGGLGSLGAQIALAEGARVFVAETNEANHDYARTLGAEAVATSITAFKDQELDLIVDFAGFGTTTAEAITTIKHGGRIVLVGVGVAEGNLPLLQLVLGAVDLVGSIAGTNEDCLAVMELMAQGKVTARMIPIGFDEIGEGLERLARGGVPGRLVAILPAPEGATA